MQNTVLHEMFNSIESISINIYNFKMGKKTKSVPKTKPKPIIEEEPKN